MLYVTMGSKFLVVTKEDIGTSYTFSTTEKTLFDTLTEAKRAVHQMGASENNGLKFVEV